MKNFKELRNLDISDFKQQIEIKSRYSNDEVTHVFALEIISFDKEKYKVQITPISVANISKYYFVSYKKVLKDVELLDMPEIILKNKINKKLIINRKEIINEKASRKN